MVFTIDISAIPDIAFTTTSTKKENISYRTVDNIYITNNADVKEEVIVKVTGGSCLQSLLLIHDSHSNAAALRDATMNDLHPPIGTFEYNKDLLNSFASNAALFEGLWGGGSGGPGDFNLLFPADTSNIIQIDLSDSITKIEKDGFKNLPRLRTINIPKNIATIQDNVFYNCLNLDNIIINSQNFINNESIEFIDNIFTDLSFTHPDKSNFQIYFDDNIIKLPNNFVSNKPKLENITFKRSIQTIEDNVFQHSKVNNVFFPDKCDLSYIGERAFDNCSLTSFKITENIRLIKSDAFKNNPLLENVSINNDYLLSQKIISDGILSGIDKQTLKYVFIGDNVATIGKDAFKDCSNIIDVSINKSVIEISDNAFMDCSALTNVLFDDNNKSKLIRVGTSAFQDCSSLQQFNITDQVQVINNNAFKRCYNLANVPIHSTNSKLNRLGNSVFEDCSKITGFRIPNKVLTIGSQCFSGCLQLTDVSFVSQNCDMSLIEQSTFEGCTNLQRVQINDNITSIGDKAFFGDIRLTDISINEASDLSYIGKSAFENCNNLHTFRIINKVYSIDNDAFKNDTKLIDVSQSKISDLSSIGSSAFENCNISSFYVTENIRLVDSNAFKGNKFLENVSINNNYLLSQKTVSDGILTGIDKTTLKYVSIEENVATIGPNAFKNCSKIIDISINKNVIEISNNAFFDCSALTTIQSDLNSKLTTIHNYAFAKCKLDHFIITDNIVLIDNNAFNACGDISRVYIEDKSKLKILGISVFEDCSKLNQFKITDNLQYIGARCFSGCLQLDNVAVNSISDISFIGNSAFQNCNISTFLIPDNIKIINNDCFKECVNLENIRFSNLLPNGNFENIGQRAFEDCSSIKFTKIHFPDSLHKIETLAFNRCRNLRSIEISNNRFSNLIIEAGAFKDCINLEDISINNGNFVGSGRVLFKDRFTENIKNVILGENVTKLGNQVFQNLKLLHNVKFDNCELLEIGSKSFKDCSSITALSFPISLTTIGNNAFEKCNISNFKITKNVTTVGESIFNECFLLDNITIDSNQLLNDIIAYTSIGDIINRDPILNPSNILKRIKTLYFNDNIQLIPSKFNPLRDNDSVLLENIYIDSSVNDIIHGSFQKINNLKNVNINFDSNLREISANVFKKCKNLKRINIPDKLIHIYENAFEECSKIEDICFNYNCDISYIGKKAFKDCSNLKKIFLPNKLTKLDDNVFYNCKTLLDVSINTNSDLHTIGDDAFYNSNLFAFKFSDNVSIVGSGAFHDCSNLETVSFGESKITKLNNNVFDNCAFKFMDLCNTLITDICNEAFANCKLLENVRFPETITTVDENIFKNSFKNVTSSNNSGQFIEMNVNLYSRITSKQEKKGITASTSSSYNSADNIVKRYLGLGNPTNETVNPIRIIKQETFKGKLDISGQVQQGKNIYPDISDVEYNTKFGNDSSDFVYKNVQWYYGGDLASALNIGLRDYRNLTFNKDNISDASFQIPDNLSINHPIKLILDVYSNELLHSKMEYNISKNLQDTAYSPYGQLEISGTRFQGKRIEPYVLDISSIGKPYDKIYFTDISWIAYSSDENEHDKKDVLNKYYTDLSYNYETIKNAFFDISKTVIPAISHIKLLLKAWDLSQNCWETRNMDGSYTIFQTQKLVHDSVDKPIGTLGFNPSFPAQGKKMIADPKNIASAGKLYSHLVYENIRFRIEDPVKKYEVKKEFSYNNIPFDKDNIADASFVILKDENIKYNLRLSLFAWDLCNNNWENRFIDSCSNYFDISKNILDVAFQPTGHVDISGDISQNQAVRANILDVSAAGKEYNQLYFENITWKHIRYDGASSQIEMSYNNIEFSYNNINDASYLIPINASLNDNINLSLIAWDLCNNNWNTRFLDGSFINLSFNSLRIADVLFKPGGKLDISGYDNKYQPGNYMFPYVTDISAGGTLDLSFDQIRWYFINGTDKTISPVTETNNFTSRKYSSLWFGNGLSGEIQGNVEKWSMSWQEQEWNKKWGYWFNYYDNVFSKDNIYFKDNINDVSYGASFMVPNDAGGWLKLELRASDYKRDTYTGEQVPIRTDFSAVRWISNQIISGADPLIKTLDGRLYKMSNFTGYSRMLQGIVDNNNLFMNVYTSKSTHEETLESALWIRKQLDRIPGYENVDPMRYLDFGEAYMRMIWLKWGENELLIDMMNLDIINNQFENIKIDEESDDSIFPFYNTIDIPKSIKIYIPELGTLIINNYKNPQIKTCFSFECVKHIMDARGAVINKLYAEDIKIKSIRSTELINCYMDRPCKNIIEYTCVTTENKKHSEITKMECF